VRVGDDTLCQIEGIGSVQIKTHDGMTCTLIGVKHIPIMVRNLISLSTLDSEGYKYRGGNKVLKVSKGSLIHMIGEPSKTNLWHARLAI
jgi:hypothetical protein